MSMFREHYIGGLIAYTLFFVLSFGASIFGQFAMQVPLEQNPTIPFQSVGHWSVFCGCGALGTLARRRHQEQKPADFLSNLPRF